LSAFRELRITIKQLLLSEITSATAPPVAPDSWWAEEFPEMLRESLIIGVSTMVAKILEEFATTAFLGGPVAALLHVLLDQRPTGGIQTRTVDTLDIIKPPNCYRITWYQSIGDDEADWGPVQVKIEQIPCPPEPAPVIPPVPNPIPPG
jgi:hypothetical protein